ncbi:MAG: zinc ribbon domain-containing protein [Firmicutes bacterium]|nr:zinc ribbon domain-containing protein [Bacillota bacterium]
MICKNCGAAMPDDATFCGECGTKVEKAKTKSPAFAKAKADAKRFKIISAILAGLCIVLAIGWIATSNDPYRDIDNYENDVLDVERAGIELTGTYVVGEDEELPEGRYNIYPPKGESYFSVSIYATTEDAKKKYDKDDNSLAIQYLYSLTRGYKLKAGQVVVIEYDSAYFELVSESGEPASEEAADTDEAADE